MKAEIRRFPYLTIRKIPASSETKQIFILPGLLVGKGYFTLFWIRTMLTVNFNTTLEI